tara:strand:+ start:1136 stop:1549 length:414 start_codon:yes stop_codon:yes gene_type:complete
MTSDQGHVRVENVEIRFQWRDGPVTALAPDTFELFPQTLTTRIGPTGFGKSTLMNAIGGFVTPSSWRITLDGAVIGEPSEQVGVIFQQYALFPWLSALDKVRFGLRKREDIDRARAALEEVGLTAHADKFPQALSGA